MQPFLKRMPAAVATIVIALVCVLAAFRPGFFQRLEWMSYDWRVKLARGHSAGVATNLGLVKITDESLESVRRGEAFIRWQTNWAKVGLGMRYGLYWPRNVYGRLIRELKAEGAEAVGFDVVFGELRSDQNPINVRGLLQQSTNDVLVQEFVKSGEVVELPDNLTQIHPDAFLALQLRNASNVVLAGTSHLIPPELFQTNAAALGDISAERDPDGVLRRVRAFWTYRKWHPVFLQAVEVAGARLNDSFVASNKLVIPQAGAEEVPALVTLDTNGNFDLTELVGPDLPPGFARMAKPFTEERLWNLGLVLAARVLQLDLDHAEVDLERGRIVLRGPGDVERVVPVDEEGWFYVDWEMESHDKRLTTESIESLLARDGLRAQGRTDPEREQWKGKLVVVGSETTGNDLTDRGATPLESDVPLMTQHWNVANSVLQGRFVTRAGLGVEILLIVLLGIVSALLTWRLRILVASAAVVAVLVSYSAAVAWVYVQHRYWLPMSLPILGGLLMNHVALVTYRVIFEQDEKKKVKSLFSRLVSPNIVNELLQTQELSLGGARREITVLFADIRGFTELTDHTYEKALSDIATQKLGPIETERYLDQTARHTLETVNLYLGMLADIVKRHDGTLDKYIGDCVMAFWGAPSPQPRHAAACVRAAIDAQRSIFRLNLERQAENARREAAGVPQLSLLPVLQMGSGINTGLASVGLMGSDEHIYNYTVFGREVNLASRLESLSGRGRIIIGETTFHHLQREEPELAASCRALEPVTVKGIRGAVQVYEVPWMDSGGSLSSTELPAKRDTDFDRRPPSTTQ